MARLYLTCHIAPSASHPPPRTPSTPSIPNTHYPQSIISTTHPYITSLIHNASHQPRSLFCHQPSDPIPTKTPPYPRRSRLRLRRDGLRAEWRHGAHAEEHFVRSAMLRRNVGKTHSSLRRPDGVRRSYRPMAPKPLSRKGGFNEEGERFFEDF